MKYRQEDNPKRHKCIRDDHGLATPSQAPLIKNVKELKDRLQQAIALEHFTIPPYLCALYSIKNETRPEARIIRTVAIEEMLHMIMAANILNAIGGEPKINSKEFLPNYPSPMPHSAVRFEVSLLRFSKEAVNTFLRIERPAKKEAAQARRGEFRSIGEFYEAVREALIRLDNEAKAKGEKRGLFTGTQPQVMSEHYYGSGGKLVAVYSIEDANRAIDEIVGQGEGIDGTILDDDCSLFGDDVELAHYFRFNEIFSDRRYKCSDKPNDAPSGDPLHVDWESVHNMVPNPKMSMFEGQPDLLKMVKAFNKTYMALLKNINEACNGNPDVVKDGVPLMFALKNQAVDLMKTPSGIGNYTVGPSFEYVP
jgi:rubrerythrin